MSIEIKAIMEDNYSRRCSPKAEPYIFILFQTSSNKTFTDPAELPEVTFGW